MARGKHKSRQQQQFMYACYPRAAAKWSHGRKTNKADWVRDPKCRGGGARSAKR